MRLRILGVSSEGIIAISIMLVLYACALMNKVVLGRSMGELTVTEENLSEILTSAAVFLTFPLGWLAEYFVSPYSSAWEVSVGMTLVGVNACLWGYCLTRVFRLHRRLVTRRNRADTRIPPATPSDGVQP